MLKKILIYGLVGCAVFLFTSVAMAEEKGNARDKAVFERLIGQRNEIYQKYMQALDEGKKQMKKDGEASLDVQNNILKLRSEKDRIESRLLTVALRHGWDIPELPDDKVGNVKGNSRELEKVFGVAKTLIRGELQKDTARLVANVNLPVRRLDLKDKKSKRSQE